MAKFLRHYIFLAGLVTVSVALAVIYGWYTSNQTLIQVNPSFAPMQYNTALGFVFTGFGLIFLFLRKWRICQFFGAMALILGASTLVQYIFGVDLQIDELFVEPIFIEKTSHPGRMAPNTALCFSLCGIALLFTRYKRSLMMGVAVAAFVIAVVSLFSYLFEHDSIYGWSNFIRMAIHTATCFVIATSALILHTLYQHKSHKIDMARFLPLTVCLSLLVIVGFAWYIIHEEGRARNQAYFEALVSDTENVLLDRYSLYEDMLRGGLGLFYASDHVSRQEWRDYVNTLDIEETLPGVSGLGYIDYVFAKDFVTYQKDIRQNDIEWMTFHPQTFYPDKFIIKYIEPLKTNIEALGLDIGFEANRRAAAERARDLGVPALTKKILLVQDHLEQPGFLLLIPVYDTKNTPETIEERRTQFKGWVYAPFIGANFLSNIGNITRNQLHFKVYDGKRAVDTALIYSNQLTASPSNIYTQAMETQISIAGRTWTISWRPSTNYRPPAKEVWGIFVVLVGLIFSIFLYVLLSVIMRSNEVIKEQVALRTRELAESEGRQSAILNNTIDAILTFGGDRKIQSFNKAAEFMFGYDASDMIGKNVSLLTYRNKDITSERFVGQTQELEMSHSEGHTFPTSVSVSRVELEDNDLFSVIIRDISHEKEAREQILKANTELKRSNNELERFAYIASHDLQEPLRKIGGFTERLEKSMEGALDDKQEKYMQFIVDGVFRMRELVMGLLAYSRVTTSELDIVELDTNEIVDLAVDNLSEVIEESKAQVVYSDLPKVFYDKVMLTQLFQNIIGNAIKYRGDEAPVITISTSKTDSCWTFAIKDNGMGMEEKYFKHIFEMFQRLHRKEDIKGTGIGLSLCQKIVERYGGDIWVESEVGKGSIFYFTIPVKK